MDLLRNISTAGLGPLSWMREPVGWEPIAGGGLRGGLVGEHPSLTDLDQDAQKPHTDFRRVYATMLERWLGLDNKAILGDEYGPLDVFT